MIEYSHYNEVRDITTTIFISNERFLPRELMTLMIPVIEEEGKQQPHIQILNSREPLRSRVF